MGPFDSLSPLWPAIAAPFIGSFLGTLALRLPRGQRLALDRSRCDACAHPLGALDLIPVVSWLAALGRCRYCRAPLSIFYPAIELAALGIALWAGFTLPGDLLWLGCGLGWCLLALGVIDLRDHLLPDILTLPLIPLGLIAAYVEDPASTGIHALSAVAGYATFRLIAFAYRSWRGRDGLGHGDAKLLAAAGAWVSWQGLPGVVLIGATASLALVLVHARSGRGIRAEDRIPFGPGSCLGLWLVWLYGPLGYIG